MDLATHHSIRQLLQKRKWSWWHKLFVSAKQVSWQRNHPQAFWEWKRESISKWGFQQYQLTVLFSVLLYLLFSSRVPRTTRKSYISFWNCWVAFQFYEAPNGPCSQRRVWGCKCGGCPEIQTCGHSVWEHRKMGCSIPKVWGAMVDSVPTSSTRIESMLLRVSGTGGNNEKGVW